MYEPSEDLQFEIRDATGRIRDRWFFYGPFSAAMACAATRCALYDAYDLTIWTLL